MTRQGGAPASSVQKLVREFGLCPHPEGGYYRETYRAVGLVQTPRGPRNASTAIYYLLDGYAHSAWHRIASDEAWHFYAGSPLDVHVLDGRGGVTTHRLGDPLVSPGAVYQTVVPAGSWFGAELAPDDGAAAERYALVGCTVAPGFEFSEFELAQADELLRDYPGHAALIRRLAPTP